MILLLGYDLHVKGIDLLPPSHLKVYPTILTNVQLEHGWNVDSRTHALRQFKYGARIAVPKGLGFGDTKKVQKITVHRLLELKRSWHWLGKWYNYWGQVKKRKQILTFWQDGKIIHAYLWTAWIFEAIERFCTIWCRAVLLINGGPAKWPILR